MRTAHGDVETPAFIPVGTQGAVKGVTNRDLESLGAEILLSNTYRQSSAEPATAARKALTTEKDPENKLLWRFTRARLDADAYNQLIPRIQEAVRSTIPAGARILVVERGDVGDGWSIVQMQQTLIAE